MSNAVIKKRKHLANLPAGSVVLNADDSPLIVLPDGLAVDRNGITFRLDGTSFEARPYRVIHLDTGSEYV